MTGCCDCIVPHERGMSGSLRLMVWLCRTGFGSKPADMAFFFLCFMLTTQCDSSLILLLKEAVPVWVYRAL